MELSTQMAWLFLLALPVAAVAWTFTHEEIFREPRQYCVERSQTAPHITQRKFFYLFTCEYCFSHYVAAFFALLTRFHLLLADWRGYLIAIFALVWVANVYMNVFNHFRLDLKKDRVEIKEKEQRVSDDRLEPPTTRIAA